MIQKETDNIGDYHKPNGNHVPAVKPPTQPPPPAKPIKTNQNRNYPTKTFGL